jgi:hypothetical protein
MDKNRSKRVYVENFIGTKETSDLVNPIHALATIAEIIETRRGGQE